MAAVIDYLDDVEIGLCLKINRLGQRSWVRNFFAVISRLGDWYFYAGMAVVLFALQGASAGPKLLGILLAAGVGLAIYKVLKACLVRERPFVHNGTIACGTAPLDKYSFPSGHTLHAVSFTIMFANAEPALMMICAPFAVLVALSRVILGLHYPSDVLVGAGIGASIATVAVNLAAW